MKKRSLLYTLLAAFMIFLMAAFPVNTYADDPEPEDPGVYVSKVAKVKEDGTYVLDLEAFATGTVTTTTVVKPCDLVLVLDASSSMGQTGRDYLMDDGTVRIQALVDAVNAFLETVAEKNAENAAAGSDLSKVAVVVFSDSSNTGVLYNFTEITTTNLVSNSVYATYTTGGIWGGTTTTYTTTGYGTNGKAFSLHNYTWTDSGLSQANTLLQTLMNSANYNAADRNRVVVMFTDGYPNHDGGVSDFDIGAARNVITNAATIKSARQASFFSIAVLGNVAQPERNPETTSSATYGGTNQQRLNQMLHAASSNYPQASVTSTWNMNWGSGGNYQAGYYKSAKTAADLKDIFKDIAETSASTETPLTSESIMKDIVSSSFTLPEDATADTIEVNVVPWDSTNHTWSTTKISKADWATQCMNYGAEAAENITVTLKDDGKTVDVKGFDYGTHFLATSDPTQDINNINKNSAKLVISFPILAKPSAVTGAYEATNGPESGIYLDGNAAEPLVAFPVPKVVFTPITYVVDYVNSDTSIDTKASSVVLDYASVLKNVQYIDDPSDDVLRGELVDDFNYTIYKGKFGTISYGDDEVDVQRRYVRYAPTTMDWNDYDRIFIKGQSRTDSDLDVWAMLAVIPANSVFYEDTYITQTKTVEYNGKVVEIQYTGINYDSKWSLVGTEGGNTTQHANHTMGWIDGLADDPTYGNGAAHTANEAKAKATFTVSGTGVDIYSRTNGSTGTVLVSLRSAANENESGAKIAKSKLIDTKAASGDYYEVPVCTFTDLPYGKYTVTIMVTAGGDPEERLIYYLDGVRVYNPIKPHEGDGLVKEVYGAENLGAVFTEVRSLLSTDATASALYIDEHTTSEIVTDVDAIEEAAKALSEAQQAREDFVEANLSPVQAVLNQAKATLDSKKLILDRATEKYNDLKAAYDAMDPSDPDREAVAAELAAAESEKEAAEADVVAAQAAVTAAQGDVDSVIVAKKPYDDAVAAAVDEYDRVNDGIVVRYTTTDVEEYNKEGPKSEVLLSKGQQVAINVEAGKTYYIGLKSLYGDEVSVLLNGTKTVNLFHTADLYYDVTPTSGNPIVIKNTTDGIGVLSITKLRTTGEGNKTNGTKLASTEETLNYVRSLAKLSAANYTGEVLTEEEAEETAVEEETVEMIEEDDIAIENPAPEPESEEIEEPQKIETYNSIWSKVLSSFFGFFRR